MVYSDVSWVCEHTGNRSDLACRATTPPPHTNGSMTHYILVLPHARCTRTPHTHTHLSRHCLHHSGLCSTLPTWTFLPSPVALCIYLLSSSLTTFMPSALHTSPSLVWSSIQYLFVNFPFSHTHLTLHLCHMFSTIFLPRAGIRPFLMRTRGPLYSTPASLYTNTGSSTHTFAMDVRGFPNAHCLPVATLRLYVRTRTHTLTLAVVPWFYRALLPRRTAVRFNMAPGAAFCLHFTVRAAAFLCFWACGHSSRLPRRTYFFPCMHSHNVGCGALFYRTPRHSTLARHVPLGSHPPPHLQFLPWVYTMLHTTHACV